MRTSRSSIAAIAVAATFVAVPAADAATTAQVGIADFRFSPSYTRIEPGDSVRWTQRGSVHTVTSRKGVPDPFDSGDLPTGSMFQMTFLAAGRFPYHCTIHPEMRGVVQVGPDTVAPKPTKLRVSLNDGNARVSFRLAEASRVSATLAAKSKPRKILRRAKTRDFQDGSRWLIVRTSGLTAGKYRVIVKAVDPKGNVATAAVALTVPAPR